MTTTTKPTLTASIGAVERETGLSKDTLRVWERRYGFPQPRRDENGDRAYPREQVERLRIIRRLIDKGMRPGKILSLDPSELAKLHDKFANGARAHVQPPGDFARYLQFVKRHHAVGLRRSLTHALLRQGVKQFVLETVAPLNVEVGEAWMRGDIAVFEEHLYTEIVQTVLRNAIAGQGLSGRAPRVLLTTFPNEQHSLGLLMVEAMLATESVECIPLGPQLPLAEMNQGVRAHRADVLALSFSAAYPTPRVIEGLTDLRNVLPEQVEIWAGGAAVGRVKRPIPGVTLIEGLGSVGKEIEAWRERHETSVARLGDRGVSSIN